MGEKTTPSISSTTQTSTPEAAPAPSTASTAPAQAPAAAGAGGGQSAAPKQDAPQTQAQGAPKPDAELKLKAPEGLAQDHPAVRELEAVAKELMLSPEQAQKLLDRNFASAKEARAREETAWKKQVADWTRETKEDPKYAEKLADVQRVMARFDPEKQLEAILGKTGMGVHPQVFSFLASLGKAAMREDSIGAGAGSGASSGELNLQSIYSNSPSMFSKGK